MEKTVDSACRCDLFALTIGSLRHNMMFMSVLIKPVTIPFTVINVHPLFHAFSSLFQNYIKKPSVPHLHLFQLTVKQKQAFLVHSPLAMCYNTTVHSHHSIQFFSIKRFKSAFPLPTSTQPAKSTLNSKGRWSDSILSDTCNWQHH